MRTFRPTIVVLALTTVIAACGTGDSTPAPATPSPTPAIDPEVGELLAAAQATLDAGTIRVDQVIEFEGSSLIPDGTSATAQGQASLGRPRRMHLRADFTAFELGRLEMIVDGSLVYMRGPVFDALAGEGRWLLVDLESSDPAAAPFKSLASGQNDVSMALYYLYGAAEAIVTAGNPIGGEIMRHFEMELDLEAARDTIPEEQSEALEDLIASLRVAGIERQLDAEAWVGGDGFIHRVLYTYRLGPAQGGGSTTTTIDFSEFGAEMELNIPDDADVVPIEEAEPPG